MLTFYDKNGSSRMRPRARRRRPSEAGRIVDGLSTPVRRSAQSRVDFVLPRCTDAPARIPTGRRAIRESEERPVEPAARAPVPRIVTYFA